MKTISECGIRPPAKYCRAGNAEYRLKKRKTSSFKFQSAISNRKSAMVSGFTPLEINSIEKNSSLSKVLESKSERRVFSEYNGNIGRHFLSLTGFTFIEIMVVVVIIGLLVAIVSPKLIDRVEDARKTQTRTQIRNLEQALKLFKLDNGFYPSTEQGLKALVEKPAAGRIPATYPEGGYMEKGKIPLDAWGNPFIYLSPGLFGEFDIISLGRDGKEGGEGPDADIYSWDIE